MKNKITIKKLTERQIGKIEFLFGGKERPTGFNGEYDFIIPDKFSKEGRYYVLKIIFREDNEGWEYPRAHYYHMSKNKSGVPIDKLFELGKILEDKDEKNISN